MQKNNFFKTRGGLKTAFLFLFLLVVSLLPLSSADFGLGGREYNYGISDNTLDKPVEITPPVNYSTVNVNNSQYLQGYTPNTLPHDGLAGVNGGSSGQYYHLNLSIFNYILSNIYSFFTGTNSPYLPTSGTTISFNDTLLNTTIDNKIANINQTNMDTFVPYNGATKNVNLSGFNLSAANLMLPTGGQINFRADNESMLNSSYFKYNVTSRRLELWVNGILQQDWGNSTTIYGKATFESDAFFKNMSGVGLFINTNVFVQGNMTSDNIFSGNICYSDGVNCTYFNTSITNLTEIIFNMNQSLTIQISKMYNQSCPNGMVFNGTLSNGTFTCTSPSVRSINPLDYIQFNLTYVTTAAEGKMYWDATDGTVVIGMPGSGNVNLQLGQEQFVRARNTAGYEILNGRAVYITGGSGQRPTVAYADNRYELSHNSLGLATENISNNNNGYITTFGFVRDVDTSAWDEGNILYLSTNGTLTNVTPIAPLHKVKMGYVVNKHATEGIIMVTIDTGDELSNLHDVLISNPTSGQVLQYNGSIWVNANSTNVAPSFLYKENNTIYFNDTLMNDTVKAQAQVKTYYDYINITTSGGSGTAYSNNIVNFLITRITVYPSSNSTAYRFLATENSTGTIIDQDRMVHHGVWDIYKTHSINFDKVKSQIISSNPDETYNIKITYSNNFQP